MQIKTRIRYKNLTLSQKLHICNGCGGKGSKIPVPSFIFSASCNHHDFQYWLGCNKAQRKKADRQFLTEMMVDTLRSNKIIFYSVWAIIYYCAVRLSGKKYFHKASEQRTLEDLNSEMKGVL
jgi:hypothetical protein